MSQAHKRGSTLPPRILRMLCVAGMGLVVMDMAPVFGQTNAVPGATSENPVQSALLEVKRDIEQDTKALNALRAAIAAERKPLAIRLDALQASVATLRAEAERRRRLRQQGEKEQAALVAEANATQEECRFLLAMFSEYGRAMETRAGAAEGLGLAKRVREVGLESVENDDYIGLAAKIEDLLKISEQWNHARLGGAHFDGTALDAAGVEVQGHFALFGPVAYFAADDDSLAGLAVTRFGTAQPSIYSLFDSEVGRNIRAVVDGNARRVPLDVTSGDAIRVKEARTGFTEHVKKGGFVMIPLLAIGVLAMVLALWKAVELGSIRVAAGPDVARAIALAREGKIEDSVRVAKTLKEPLAALILEAIAHRASPREHLEEIMHEHVLGSLPRLERHLGTLAVLGGVTPLLGLLGTVTGMIHTFQLVTVFGSGDAKLLSGGISEALVTTEFGLLIAIPVLLAHAFLARRARGIVGAMERTAVAVVNDLKVRAVGS